MLLPSPSSILELGWKHPTPLVDLIRPFPRRFPDDIIPSLCRQLHPQDDANTLVALQRVSREAEKAATRRLYARIEFGSQRSLTAFINGLAKAPKHSSRSTDAAQQIRTISIPSWNADFARHVVIAISTAFAGLPKSTKSLLAGDVGLVLGDGVLEAIIRTEASYGGQPDEDYLADQVATMGLPGGMITRMAAGMRGQTGGVWQRAGPFSSFLRGANGREVNRIALNILFNRLAPITELCVTVPPTPRCPTRRYNEHPTEYSRRCLDTLTQATYLANLPVVNVHNGRFDDPLSFSFAGKRNRIHISPTSGPFGSYTPEIVESGLLNALAKGKFERPVKNEVILLGQAAPQTNHEWGSMVLQAYRAWCMRTYPGQRGEREYQNRIKTMKQTLGKEAVEFNGQDIAACGVCGGS